MSVNLCICIVCIYACTHACLCVHVFACVWRHSVGKRTRTEAECSNECDFYLPFKGSTIVKHLKK